MRKLHIYGLKILFISYNFHTLLLFYTTHTEAHRLSSFPPSKIKKLIKKKKEKEAGSHKCKF